jgi:thiamine transport system substrate-binding protein
MRRFASALAALAIVVGACANDGGEAVTVVAHDFFLIDQALIDQFTAETGIEVEVVLGGDAGLVVNQAILNAGNPIGDVLFGVDTTLLSRAVAADVFAPYTSRLRTTIRSDIPPVEVVTPIDFGDVCLNYDRSALAGGPGPPNTLRDLALPRYEGMLVVEDPTISSPGLVFMLATIAEFGETGDYTWLDYWADLRANDVLVASDWGTAYYGHFSGASNGNRPIVVSYATSPGAELLGESPPAEPSTAVIDAGCFRQVEYAGILRGTDNRAAAEEFIDFLLSRPVQEDVPWSMFVYPVRADATLPEWLGPVPEEPGLQLDPEAIEANRARWLTEWSETVLR